MAILRGFIRIFYNKLKSEIFNNKKSLKAKIFFSVKILTKNLVTFMGLRMKNLNILGVHWKGFRKNQYWGGGAGGGGDCLKREGLENLQGEGGGGGGLARIRAIGVFEGGVIPQCTLCITGCHWHKKKYQCSNILQDQKNTTKTITDPCIGSTSQ